LKAIRTALSFELVATCATREFEITATRIPMYPAAIEQVAPKRKPSAVKKSRVKPSKKKDNDSDNTHRHKLPIQVGLCSFLDRARNPAHLIVPW